MKRTILSQGFAELRKNGYFAKQNFWCCNSCAWDAMTSDEAQKAVFYHSQEAASYRKTGDVYLAWNGNGHEIVNTFLRLGMRPEDVEWDGTPNRKILLKNIWMY